MRLAFISIIFLALTTSACAMEHEQPKLLDSYGDWIITRPHQLSPGINIRPTQENNRSSDLGNQTLYYSTQTGDKKIMSAKFGMNRASLLILSEDKVLTLWNLNPIQLINAHNTEIANQKIPSSMRFNSNRSMLAIGFKDGTIHILNTLDLTLLSCHKPSKRDIRSIIFSKDNAILGVTTHDAIFFWKLFEKKFFMLCKIQLTKNKDAISIKITPSKFLLNNPKITYKFLSQIKSETQSLNSSVESTTKSSDHIVVLCAYYTTTRKILLVLPNDQRFETYLE